MATRNISTRISLDGEQEFKKQMTAVNGEMRNLKVELKLTEAEFRSNGDAQAYLTQKGALLKKEIEQQEIKVKALEQAVEDATKAYGEADSRTDGYRQSLLTAKAALLDMEKAMTENQKTLDRSNSLLVKLGSGAKTAADGLVKAAPVAGKAAKTIATGVAGAATAAVAALNKIDEDTREFRENQAKLVTAFEAVGAGANVAEAAYSGFFGVVGDAGAATESSQLLAQIATSTQDVAAWTDIAAGAVGAFGDSLPVNSLIEFSAEMIKGGQITGDMTRILQYAGIEEEAFQAQLDACTTEAERNALVTSTLSNALGDAADAFKTNNAEAMANRETQLETEKSMAKLGEAVAKVKTGLQREFSPALGEVAEAFGKVIEGAEDGDEALQQALENLVDNAVEKVPEFLEFGLQIITAIAKGIITNIPELLGSLPELAATLWDAIMELGGELLEMGADLWDYIWSGITGGAKSTAKSQSSKVNGSHAGGLDYVPFDGYRAILHRGEAVLTAQEAGVLRSLSGGLGGVRQGITAAEIQSAAAAALSAAGPRGSSSQSFDLRIEMDGQVLARKSYSYNKREGDLRGGSLVEV